MISPEMIAPETMTIPHPTHPVLVSDLVPAQEPGNPAPELAAAAISVLLELEAGLHSSQKALLARDMAGVEQGTREQIRLRRALEILAPWEAARTSSELRTTAMRILHLGRVQAALLDRARRWSRMISNLLAGPEASYGRPLCAGDIGPGHRDHGTTKGTTEGTTEEPDQCPA